jgi:hypothetical protein
MVTNEPTWKWFHLFLSHIVEAVECLLMSLFICRSFGRFPAIESAEQNG